jgi:DNA polymerase-3 subunit alpha (Gram-positive type)
MSLPDEKRNRFEMLLQQASLPKELLTSYFKDTYLDKVVVSPNKRDWIIHFVLIKLVPQDVFRSFCQTVKDKFSHIANISFVFEYTDAVEPATIVHEYWNLCMEWIKQDLTSVNGWLMNAKIAASDTIVVVEILDPIGLDIANKKRLDQHIVQFFRQYFDLTLQVKLQMSESNLAELEQFSKRIQQEENRVTQEMLTVMMKQPEVIVHSDPNQKLQIGIEIKDVPVPLMQIREEEKKITVQGVVFGVEERELRNGSTLFTFNITDFTDSLNCKAFAKTKEDVRLYRLLTDGKWIITRGKIEYDRFSPPGQSPELMFIPQDLYEIVAPPERSDKSEEKRVEFHLHTVMSTMDAVSNINDYIQTAAKWGHKAVAITDHGNVHAFPDASKAAKKAGIKMIYGLEANVVNDSVAVVDRADERKIMEAEYVIFDIETTGLSVTANKIIEIAGVKMQGGKVIDRYSSFVDPRQPIPNHISQLTHITNEMVEGQPEINVILPQFVEFVGNAVLVAHNARFDMGFLQANLRLLGMPEFINSTLDTLELARLLYPSLKNHRLNTLSDKFKVKLENHHRAVDDAEALGLVLYHLLKDANERRMDTLIELNDQVGQNLATQRPFHCCIYARNQLGKKNLFKLISLSHTQYLNRVPCIPKSKLIEYREGIIVLSGCEKGEFYETVLNKSIEEAEQVAEFYDVLEIQPVDINMHLVDKGLVGSREELENTIRRICELGTKLGKPVVATGNVHYLHPRQKICRDITIHGITGFSPLKDQRKPDVHFRTTEEMLREFAFLGEDKAKEVVIANTNKLADEFEEIQLFPKKLFSPIIDGAEQEIEEKCYARAKVVYGDSIPELIRERLERELKPIIENGFSANILISERLVKKSNEDGYLVGSRGSVGSLFVANMLGISEVNPLPPHYFCPICTHSEFFTDGSIGSGFDLPDKECPKCGSELIGEGQDIPAETFMGFTGEKVPDIDLNFSGEYQPHAHNYTKVLFGEKNVFRAGTIGTVAEKTAFGFVKKYEEELGKSLRLAEINRLALGCTGVKRSTGQHPGGIVVVPDYIEIEDITPVQYPADDKDAEWKTTHFDYHAFDENLLKLDILGHDDPTMMRMLQDLTGVDPTKIKMNDSKTMSLFNSVEALGISSNQIRSSVATFGIPEMGTKFVRQMLEETRPSTFADLLQISGLSHGTGVWIGNAQELIRKKICTIKTVIGCRDDIMLYLIYKAGLDKALAFKITESVRKGKGLTDEWKQVMKQHDVPDWYIDSCEKIEYMFPRAHAAAYVTSAVRSAYFKLYYPIAFYCTYFSVRAADFDVDLFSKGYDAIMKKLIEIEEKAFQATTKEKAMISILEMGLEMTARGFQFKSIDLYRSQANRFIIDGNSLIPPFSSVQGIGENAARQIEVAREQGPFLSIEDFQSRSKVSRTVIELLAGMGCFRGLPESNQLSLF